jgi:hypothetical protein
MKLSDDLVKQAAKELPLPYRFDVRTYSGIQSPDLLDHIRRVGKVVYEKNA